jgi:hypothetical protein
MRRRRSQKVSAGQRSIDATLTAFTGQLWSGGQAADAYGGYEIPGHDDPGGAGGGGDGGIIYQPESPIYDEDPDWHGPPWLEPIYVDPITWSPLAPDPETPTSPDEPVVTDPTEPDPEPSDPDFPGFPEEAISRLIDGTDSQCANTCSGMGIAIPEECSRLCDTTYLLEEDDGSGFYDPPGDGDPCGPGTGVDC